MPERRNRLIVKSHEPTGTYADSLPQLPGSEDDLTDSLEVIVKLRAVTDSEAEEIDSRDHVIGVYEDTPVSADADVSTDARMATMTDIARYHGFDVAHRMGYRGQGRAVAIVDTGLSAYWEREIAGRIFARRSYVSGESHTDTTSGHGTHVTGTVATLAPAAKIGVYKNLSTRDGSGSSSGGISAINQAVKDGCTDINCSWGGPGSPSSPTSLAVDAARRQGVRVTGAAGNEQRGRSDYTSDGRSPASAKGTCTVGCGDIDGNLSSFSSWGKCVDIRAVGEAQESWGITGRKVLSGTSMASPVVAAAGAVCGSKGASVGEIDRALYAMTGDTGYSWVQEGRGILDVEFAVKKIERKARRK